MKRGKKELIFHSVDQLLKCCMIIIHSVGGGLQGLLSLLFQTLLPEIEGLIQFGESL